MKESRFIRCKWSHALMQRNAHSAHRVTKAISCDSLPFSELTLQLAFIELHFRNELNAIMIFEFELFKWNSSASKIYLHSKIDDFVRRRSYRFDLVRVAVYLMQWLYLLQKGREQSEINVRNSSESKYLYFLPFHNIAVSQQHKVCRIAR